jgi:hypothetical protein
MVLFAGQVKYDHSGNAKVGGMQKIGTGTGIELINTLKPRQIVIVE